MKEMIGLFSFPGALGLDELEWVVICESAWVCGVRR